MKDQLTIEDIRAANPKTIFYGSRTAWWTHDPEDLHTTKPLPESFSPKGAKNGFGGGMPCGASGEMLYEMHEPEKWLKAAESKPGHFGKHGIKAFMASHAQNCNGVFSPNWNDYNNMLDGLNEAL